MPSRTVRVTENEAGLRLDVCLAHLIPELSRAQIRRLIDRDQVQGPARRPSDRVRAGWEFVLELARPAPGRGPQEVPFGILYQDEHLVVVDKPAGLVVHPAPGNADRTLVHGLLARVGNLATLGAPLRPGIVHRLDKDTSGLLVVARTDSAYQSLAEQIASRQARRHYTALVCGHMKQKEGTIEASVGRSRRDRKLMSVDRRGREAVTHYRVTGAAGPCDILDVRLESGRTHQIRVHLRHLGKPVFGDPSYGGRGRWALELPVTVRLHIKNALDVLRRQALHARMLRFTHPHTGEPMQFESVLPADMSRAIEILRG